MEILKIENLKFSYPCAQMSTLHGVSFSVEAGEFVALIGATGSGKSTLMRLLKRELAPLGKLEGSILYMGTPQAELDERTSACKIGYVMQRPEQQIVTDKVWHELAFALENMGLEQGVIRRRVAEMASYFGISDWFERDVSSLSGGQKQLLNLASVMVAQPDVLLLDEPTSQLDPIAASDFLNTVRKLNLDMGITVLLIEHRLEEALPMSDRVLVLENGELVLDAPPKAACEALRTHPVLVDAMPGAVRLFHAVNGSGQCPITVRDGRNYLRSSFSNVLAARWRLSIPPTATEMVPVSSETMTTSASETSLIPIAARCLVPKSELILRFCVRGSTQPAAAMRSSRIKTAPSCKAAFVKKIFLSNSLLTCASINVPLF